MLLQVSNLRKSYSGRTVVDGVEFHVDRSEIVGLLGRNGAGKTTSFRMTIGMIDADAGRVEFDGRDVSRLPMYKRARLGMGYLSQEPSVFQRMTCRQNLLAILETLPLSRRERFARADELLDRFGLQHKSRHQARTCSGGERRKLEIARALVTNPKLILLDEPFSGVDPIAVEDLQAEITRLRDVGIACLVTDHNVQQTLRVCDRACIIDEGKKFAEGTPKELINNEQVRRVYLGSLFRGDEFDDVPERKSNGARPSAVRGKSARRSTIAVHMTDRNAHPATHHFARATNGLVLSCVALGLGGCLERTISVTSEPPGAVVWLNDVQVGRTPVDVDFTFYGVYDIRLQREGYEPLATSREAKAPLQETPGIDLLAELWPQRITDRVEWHFVLEPTIAGVASPGEAREALLDRARSLGASLDEK